MTSVISPRIWWPHWYPLPGTADAASRLRGGGGDFVQISGDDGHGFNSQRESLVDEDRKKAGIIKVD